MCGNMYVYKYVCVEIYIYICTYLLYMAKSLSIDYLITLEQCLKFLPFAHTSITIRTWLRVVWKTLLWL